MHSSNATALNKPRFHKRLNIFGSIEYLQYLYWVSYEF